MAYTFAEGLIDEIVNYLNTNLAAKLDTIEAEIGDSITLDDVATYARRDPEHPRSVSALPMVFVRALQTRVEQWKTASTRQRHTIWIYLVCRDTDPETLAKKQYRYGQALWRTLVDGHFAGSITWSLVGQQPLIDYSAAFTNGSIVLADVRLEAQFEKLEAE